MQNPVYVPDMVVKVPHKHYIWCVNAHSGYVHEFCLFRCGWLANITAQCPKSLLIMFPEEAFSTAPIRRNRNLRTPEERVMGDKHQLFIAPSVGKLRVTNSRYKLIRRSAITGIA
jgi:hypothetical protein